MNLCYKRKCDVLYYTWKYNVSIQKWCYIRNYGMSELMLHTRMCNAQLHVMHKYETCFIRTYVIYEQCNMSERMLDTKIYIVSKLFHIWKCVMFEPILRTEIWCHVSELTLHMTMCNVRTYITHEYDMCSIRAYRTYELMLHTKMLYIRTLLRTKILCIVSEIMLHTKMSNVQTYVTREHEMCSIRAYRTHEKNTSELMLHMKIWCVSPKMLLHSTMLYVRTYVSHENIMFFVQTCITCDNV